MNRVLGEPASCFVFPFLHCMPFKELCVDRLLSAGENEYTPPFILCQQIFYFFSKIFHFFFTFFFTFFPRFFPQFQAHSLRGGRLLSVTGGRGGFPRPAFRGAGSAKTGGAWPPDDDARDWSGAQRTAAAMPRVEVLPAAGTDCHAERGASLPRRLAPAWAARHGAGRRNRAKPGARGVAPYMKKAAPLTARLLD